MKISILGTGVVGRTLGSRLISLGHSVMMGSRSAAHEGARAWADENGGRASVGTFAVAAAFGDLVLLCVKGETALEALALAGEDNLSGKVLLDITNPLDFSRGMPPSLYPQWSNTTSLGEAIQSAFPSARVVKSLNIVNCELMADPRKLSREMTMFLCGNDARAKEQVRELLEGFGWEDILDLGDLSGARGMEMMLPVWLRIYMSLRAPGFGFKVVR